MDVYFDGFEAMSTPYGASESSSSDFTLVDHAATSNVKPPSLLWKREWESCSEGVNHATSALQHELEVSNRRVRVNSNIVMDNAGGVETVPASACEPVSGVRNSTSEMEHRSMSDSDFVGMQAGNSIGIAGPFANPRMQNQNNAAPRPPHANYLAAHVDAAPFGKLGYAQNNLPRPPQSGYMAAHGDPALFRTYNMAPPNEAVRPAYTIVPPNVYSEYRAAHAAAVLFGAQRLAGLKDLTFNNTARSTRGIGPAATDVSNYHGFDHSASQERIDNGYETFESMGNANYAPTDVSNNVYYNGLDQSVGQDSEHTDNGYETFGSMDSAGYAAIGVSSDVGYNVFDQSVGRDSEHTNNGYETFGGMDSAGYTAIGVSSDVGYNGFDQSVGQDSEHTNNGCEAFGGMDSAGYAAIGVSSDVGYNVFDQSVGRDSEHTNGYETFESMDGAGYAATGVSNNVDYNGFDQLVGQDSEHTNNGYETFKSMDHADHIATDVSNEIGYNDCNHPVDQDALSDSEGPAVSLPPVVSLPPAVHAVTVQFERNIDLAGYAGWPEVVTKGSRFMHVELVNDPFFDSNSDHYALEVLERAVAVYKETNPGKLDDILTCMNVVKLIKPIVRRGNDKSKVMRIILGGAHDKRPSFHFSLMENHAIKEQISIWADTNGHAHVIDELTKEILSYFNTPVFNRCKTAVFFTRGLDGEDPLGMEYAAAGILPLTADAYIFSLMSVCFEELISKMDDTSHRFNEFNFGKSFNKIYTETERQASNLVLTAQRFEYFQKNIDACKASPIVLLQVRRGLEELYEHRLDSTPIAHKFMRTVAAGSYQLRRRHSLPSLRRLPL